MKLIKVSPRASWIGLLAVLLLSPIIASGQVITGTLVGTVRDSSGSVIPNASVNIVLPSRSLERTAQTNKDGDFSVPFLPMGAYRLSVTVAGFQTEIRSNVQLGIDQTVRTDFTLTVGAVSQEVTVTEETPLLATDASNIGDTLEQATMTGLPLKGRQFIELVLLSAGVTPEIPGQTGGQFNLAGSSVNVNGNRSDSNNFLLDGVPINDSMWGRMAISPSVDAIGEMKVQSFMYSAEFGSAGGGQINLTLRSGTNQFHGTGFGFFRRDIFDAKNYFAPTKPALTQNNYGFSFGGPVLHDKLFFFTNFERLTTASGFTLVSTLPTMDQRNGIFTTTIVDPITGLPFPGNQILPNRINSVSTAVLALVPVPMTGGTNNYSTVENENSISTQGSVKADYQLGQKNTFSGHFSISDISGDVPAVGTPPGFTPTVVMNTRTYGAQWTRTIGTSSVNQARFGYTYSTSVEPSAHPGLDFAAQNGILGTSHDPAVLGVPRFTITGYSVIGDLTSTLNGTSGDYHFIDDFSHTAGSHSLKLGAIVSRLKPSPLFFPSPRGNYNFLGGTPSALTTGNPFADFLLGIPTTGAVGVGNPQLNARAWRFGAYIQDDWRATSRLTFNLGLRYEILTPPVDINNKLSNLDLTTGHFILACNNGQPSPIANLALFPQFNFVCNNAVGLGRGLTKVDGADLGPRLGLSFGITKDIVLRAGYGIFYSYPPMAVRIGTPSFSIPFFTQTTATNSKTAPVSTQNLFVTPGVNALSGQPFSPDYLAGRTQQWSVDLQKQIGTRLIDVAYLGAYGMNLDAEELPNQATPGPGTLASRTPLPLLANNFIFSGPFAYSDYNALQVRFEQRAWHGLSLSSSYTFAKSLDDASNLLSNTGNSGVPQNSRNIQAEYGRSNFDIRHRFTANGLYEIPTNFDSPLVRSVLGGWGVGSTVILQGNLPLSPVEATDVSGTGAFMDRPNAVGNPNANAPHTPKQWFNTAAFVAQPAGTFGNTARNTIYGPTYKDVDAALIKHVAIRERHVLELRIEAFNVLNHTNFLNPARTFGSATFGVISGAQDPRVMQWGVKYSF